MSGHGQTITYKQISHRKLIMVNPYYKLYLKLNDQLFLVKLGWFTTQSPILTGFHCRLGVDMRQKVGERDQRLILAPPNALVFSGAWPPPSNMSPPQGTVSNERGPNVWVSWYPSCPPHFAPWVRVSQPKTFQNNKLDTQMQSLPWNIKELSNTLGMWSNTQRR